MTGVRPRRCRQGRRPNKVPTDNYSYPQAGSNQAAEKIAQVGRARIGCLPSTPERPPTPNQPPFVSNVRKRSRQLARRIQIGAMRVRAIKREYRFCFLRRVLGVRRILAMHLAFSLSFPACRLGLISFVAAAVIAASAINVWIHLALGGGHLICARGARRCPICQARLRASRRCEGCGFRFHWCGPSSSP